LLYIIFSSLYKHNCHHNNYVLPCLLPILLKSND
jgi:hypothetical protein